MEKNKILGSQDNTKIIRILEVKESSFLVIDCIKRTMPQWKDKEQFKDWKSVTEQELWEITNIYPSKTDTALSTTSKYIQEHYALIAGILTFIGDEKERSRMIRSIAELKNYSKQTIRNTLCLYLVYQDISVLAPKEKKEKELSRDEKIMRWSLNKFFYTKNQNTLTTAYTMMLAPEGKAIAFRLDKNNGFEWIGEYDISADELLNGEGKGQKTRKAKEFLLEILADGGMAQKKIEEEAEKMGIKKKTLRNAKMELGIDSVKRGNQWYWMLSE